MKQDALTVAIVGATSLVGREIVGELEARQFPLRTRRLLDSRDAITDAPYEETAELEPIEDADLRGIDLAFLARSPALSRAWASRLAALGACVIDLTQAFAADETVPVVVPEVNPSAIGGRARGLFLASPVAGAIALSVVLQPLRTAAGLRRVVVAGYESVSAAGQEGILELSQQTAGLMNGQDVEVTLFPHRIAFNAIPQVGDFLPDGSTRVEWETTTQVRRLLLSAELPLAVTHVLVPAFFGTGYAVSVELEHELTAEAARRVLREAPGLLLVDAPDQHAYPTLADALDESATYVGRVRRDASVAHGLLLWIAIDGVRKGGAVNAVHIAELAHRICDW